MLVCMFVTRFYCFVKKRSKQASNSGEHHNAHCKAHLKKMPDVVDINAIFSDIDESFQNQVQVVSDKLPKP
jgi:hypothetical protein